MTPEVTKRIMDRIAKYPDMSNKRIADGIRVDGVRVSAASVASMRSGEPLGKNVEYKKAGVKTLSIEDVVAPHDKVGEALSKIKSIPAGQLMDDETLRKEVSISNDRWRRARGSTRLAGLWYILPDKSYVWGQKSTIASLDARLKEVL